MSNKVSPSKFNVVTSQKVRTVFRTVRVVCFTLLMTKTINTALLRGKTYEQLLIHAFLFKSTNDLVILHFVNMSKNISLSLAEL